MQILRNIIIVVGFVVPNISHSEVDFNFRFGTGASIFLNLPESHQVATRRVSAPVLISIGIISDNKFGFHLNGTCLLIDDTGYFKVIQGYYISFSAEYHFLPSYKELFDFYALSGIGWGGVIMYIGPYRGMDDIEDGSGGWIFTIGVGMNIKVLDWLNFGFQPRLRFAYPGHPEIPSLEFLLITNVLW